MTDYNDVKPKQVLNNPDTEIAKAKARLDKVVSGDVVKVKKGLLERLVVSFIGPEGAPAVGRYVMREVVTPAIKNIVADSVTSGINAMMFGRDGRPGNNSYHKATGYYSQNRSGSRNSRTQYNRASSGYHGSESGPQDDIPVRGNRFNSEDYSLPDRNEALSVLDALNDQIEQYGLATVADFYDLIGITSDFVDHSWGWSDLSTAQVRVYRDQFVISLPNPGKVK